MPLYEYGCSDCGEIFEVMLRFSESDKHLPCPKCDSTRTKKKISSVASVGSSSTTAYSTSSNNCGSRAGFS